MCVYETKSTQTITSYSLVCRWGIGAGPLEEGFVQWGYLLGILLEPLLHNRTQTSQKKGPPLECTTPFPFQYKQQNKGLAPPILAPWPKVSYHLRKYWKKPQHDPIQHIFHGWPIPRY